MERRVLLAIFLAFIVLYAWQALFVKPVPKGLPAATAPSSSPALAGSAAPAGGTASPAATPAEPAGPAAPPRGRRGLPARAPRRARETGRSARRGAGVGDCRAGGACRDARRHRRLHQ